MSKCIICGEEIDEEEDGICETCDGMIMKANFYIDKEQEDAKWETLMEEYDGKE